MDEIQKIDHYLFEKINGTWTNFYFDTWLPIFTDLHQLHWPVFVLGFFFSLWIYLHRGRAVRAILGLLLSVAVSDTVSYHVIKPLFERKRPAYTEGVNVNLKTPDHSGLSFPSNHSANVFSGATFLSNAYPGLSPVFIIIAIVVAYSRIYVGVHFPLDVLGGAILGIICGYLVFRLVFIGRRQIIDN